jgi:hypothetical protein
MNMIKIDLDKLTPVQLAALYRAMVRNNMRDVAQDVLAAGLRNCGHDFILYVAVAQ